MKFVGYGKLYEAGRELMYRGPHITSDMLDDIVQASPKTIPVLNEYLGNAPMGPEKVIGRAELFVEGDFITTKITFNERWRKAYESLLQCNSCRKRHRLGFVMRHCLTDADTNELKSGIFTYVALSQSSVGGTIDKFGWEEEKG